MLHGLGWSVLSDSNLRAQNRFFSITKRRAQMKCSIYPNTVWVLEMGYESVDPVHAQMKVLLVRYVMLAYLCPQHKYRIGRTFIRSYISSKFDKAIVFGSSHTSRVRLYCCVILVFVPSSKQYVSCPCVFGFWKVLFLWASHVLPGPKLCPLLATYFYDLQLAILYTKAISCFWYIK